VSTTVSPITLISKPPGANARLE